MIDGRNDQYPDPEDRPRPIRDIDDRADDAYEEVRQRVIESPCIWFPSGRERFAQLRIASQLRHAARPNMW